MQCGMETTAFFLHLFLVGVFFGGGGLLLFLFGWLLLQHVSLFICGSLFLQPVSLAVSFWLAVAPSC